MRTPYTFSILRYVHDPVTQEFINIGVAVYSREAGFLRAVRLRQLTRYIQEQVSAIGESLPTELPFETGGAIESLLARVLPPDDSSVQFSRPGAGLSQDLEKTTAELFERYVERYSLTSESSRRDDEDIWRSCWE